MAGTADERLNRLQEADLGTARREDISTRDRTFRETRIELIEASRRSNMPGTEEQRVAEKNKTCLEAWANVHKKIGDTGDLEGLNNLLNGQSHRLRLDEMMRGTAASISGNTERRRGDFVGATQRMPAIPTGPAAGRGSQSLRRPSRNGATSTQSRGGLGPALNKKNVGNNAIKPKSVGKPGSSAAHLPLLRTKRPLGDFSRAISSPESFLAAARGKTSTRQSPKKASPAKATPQDTPNIRSPAGASSSQPQQPTNGGQRFENHVAFNRSAPLATVGGAEPPVHKSSPNTTTKRASITASIYANKPVKSQQELDTGPQDLAAVTNVTTPTAPPQKADGILLDLSFAAPSKSGPEPEMSPALEELQGLNFEQVFGPQTPSSDFTNANRRLDFGGALHTEQKSSDSEVTEATTGSLEEDYAEYKHEIDTICNLLQRTSLSDIFLSDMTECKAKLESKVRDIEKLIEKRRNQQLADTPTPKSEKLKSVTKAADASAHEDLPKPERGQTQPSLTSTAPEHQENKPVAPTTVEATTQKHSRNTSLSTPTSQSRLNGAARQFTPGAFTIHRSVSNATSTDSSTSFHSTLAKSIPGTPLQKSIDEPSRESTDVSIKAQFRAKVHRNVGEAMNLLPSGKAGTLKKAGNPEETRGPVRSHLYGDHLLPGRRVTPPFGPSLTRPGIPPYPQSVLAQAASPKFSNINFTLPPQPKPMRIVEPNISAGSNENAQSALLSMASTSRFDPTKESLAIRPGNAGAPVASTNTFDPMKESIIFRPRNTRVSNVMRKATVQKTSMMESIYAPKPKVVSSSSENTKPSVSQGLMGSRYADAQWL
ncbi:uncharacterized protein BDV17DRAFT_134260 [Aspergillus undulatus]|uniref:uncharacterized protein n=1 Tax=Aspergillus undulatus TaxID=1810928 RepID=UPI003CCDB0EB